MDALRKAIELCKGQSALARLITTPERPVCQSHVWNWLNRDKKVPANQCLAIERATGGQVTRYQLRPDVFGPAPEEETTAA